MQSAAIHKVPTAERIKLSEEMLAKDAGHLEKDLLVDGCELCILRAFSRKQYAFLDKQPLPVITAAVVKFAKAADDPAVLYYLKNAAIHDVNAALGEQLVKPVAGRAKA